MKYCGRRKDFKLSWCKKGYLHKTISPTFINRDESPYYRKDLSKRYHTRMQKNTIHQTFGTINKTKDTPISVLFKNVY